jgi:error-prone DNA polymerase
VTIAQFDKDDVEDLGLVKIDLLSLRTLGAIEDALGYRPEIDYDRIPLDDKATYDRLQTGDTIGMFQLESPLKGPCRAGWGRQHRGRCLKRGSYPAGPMKGNMVEPFH